MKLVLFDIDGTLIDSGGAGRRALNHAMFNLFNLNDAFSEIDLAGKTDLQIIKEGLNIHNISINGNIDRVTDAYIRFLKTEILSDNKKILPGIYNILNILKGRNDTGIGLLTGNIRNGARIKLEAFDIYKYFKSGAFGSDDEDRNKLVPVAVKRFEAIYDMKIHIKDCIIVGDTPRDVECAKIHGAIGFGVATGLFSFDELIKTGADVTVENLSDPEPLLKLL